MTKPEITQDTSETILWDTLREECRSEVEQARHDLLDISVKIDQSQLEVTKLQQRNASISTRLQQIKTQLEITPKVDIHKAYDSALEDQQRLFVMTGQLDKLQSDKSHIVKHITLLEKILNAIEIGNPQSAKQHGLSLMSHTVEMIIQAQESERQRLARQMHDGPAQALSNFILQTEIATRYFEIDQAKAKEELAAVKHTATNTFQKIRDFIYELRPMMLDDLGLVPTLDRYVEMLKEQSGIEIRFISSGMEQRLEPYLEVMIFRAIQELLNNAIQHSQASQVKLQVDANSSEVRVTVEDNGKGFVVETMGDKGGMGLNVIRDRVEMVGGELQIHSILGQGSHISFRIPATTTSVFA